MPLRLTSRVKSKSVLPIFVLVSWDIKVASVIKLPGGLGACCKFVYDWGVNGFCPPCTEATSLVGRLPYWPAGGRQKAFGAQ